MQRWRDPRCTPGRWAMSVDLQRQAAMNVVQPDRVRAPGSLPKFGIEAQTLSTQEALAAPCYTAWLAVTARSLVTLGRLFQTAPSWLEACAQHSRDGRCPSGIIMMLSMHASAFDWLSQQLTALQEHPASPAAAAVPTEVLNKLQQQSATLAPKFKALLELCDSAPLVVVGPGAALQAAVFEAILQGCAEGWLPEGLQKLGAGVWAAWPQRLACNDDRCTDLSRLTEGSCGRMKCTGCGVAYYCCKEHQARHWKRHKPVCEHLKELAQQKAPPS